MDNELASFVQIRGSIPLFWRQNINIKYKPPFEFYNHSSMSKVFREHFAQLLRTYGPVTAVNLVNHGGWEGHLAREFGKQVRELSEPNLNYVPFDFNKQCPRMQWNRVSLLIDRISEDLDRHVYFRGNLDRSLGDAHLAFTEVLQEQKGVVRTNCIDCLDRTNLLQGFIAKRALIQQLVQLGALQKGDSINVSPPLETLFKQIWADNGDAISKQYSGTGALKADFTRTGRRTKRGILADGLNSLIRYYLNNFTDGERQDAMDLFYGHYTVRLDEYYSPFIYHFDRNLIFAPILLVGSLLFMFYFGLVSHPSRIPFSITMLLTVVTFLISVFFILQNGIHYVQYPKLRPPPVVSYIRPISSVIADGRRKFFDKAVPSRKVHVI